MRPTVTVVFCLFLFGTVSCAPSANETNGHLQKPKSIQCTGIFQEVGDHCLIADNSIFGSWYEMRQVCFDLGGDLLTIHDANFLANVSRYLTNMSVINDVTIPLDYWVGSTDSFEEGVWQWISDYSPVKMGTPLWGDNEEETQQPRGTTKENCGSLHYVDHYYMHDSPCTETFCLLCQQRGQQVIKDSMNTDSKPKIITVCPEQYIEIADKCLFFDNLNATSWYAHRTTCERLGGHMIKIDDANVLGAIFDYLTDKGITQNFWIGANDEEQEDYWQWLDGSPVQLGTPFWGDNATNIQSPKGGYSENCALIDYKDHYFFHDTDCENNEYVICQIDVS